ncbi:cytochrome c5 family protein [Moraxella caviae]|nr:cytochrome c5 family protein [Moraxella caviae]
MRKTAQKLIVATLCASVLVSAPAVAAVADTYQKTCATCHDSGALNAPKKGDTAIWERLKSQKGMDALVQSTKKGMPQMPAMGLCGSCSDQDFKDLINYMAN